MKFMLACEEALKNINKGKMGIFNFGYQVLDVKPIRYSQHLACVISASWKHGKYRASARQKNNYI